MKFLIYRNIILFLFASIVMSFNTPVSNAGEDIFESVTSCSDLNISILADGSDSGIDGDGGVCDTGVCYEINQNGISTGSILPNYCTTAGGPTDETCLVSSDCGEIKSCVGGDNNGDVCTNESFDYCGTGVCEFVVKCFPKFTYQSHCEGDEDEDGIPNGVWEVNYEDVSESTCESYYGEKNYKWYDYSLSYNWTSDSDRLNIVDNTSAITNIVFDPLDSPENQIDEVYLEVVNSFSDTTFVDKDTLLINLDPELPCAVSGDDIYLCRACADENSTLYDSTYVEDILSVIQFDASNSYSNNGSNFRYSWNVPEGFELSDSTLVNPELIMGSDHNNYANIRKAMHIFTLEVADLNNLNSVSLLDTLVIYFNPSSPAAPKVEVYPENDKVTLNWSRNASTFSVDSLSGYSDFEGYRIYKSIDGGETWGSADDRIYYNGEHVGWRHESQSDLSEYQDNNFCVKGVDPAIIGEGLQYRSWEECVSGEALSVTCCIEGITRDVSISNLDPYAPWINLGDDGGLNFSYIDTNVYNGKEYTYAVVAYDMGLPGYVNETSPTGDGICDLCDGSQSELTEQLCCENNGGVWGNDDICTGSCSGVGHIWVPTYEYIEGWPSTNPDQFTYDGINGHHSLESDLIDSVNVVTTIPAFYAQNVELISDFIDEDEDFGIPAENKLWDSGISTAVGNGGIYFQIINPYNITDKRYEFQVQADYAGSDVEIFEGYKTESPKLYAWEVSDDNSPSLYDYSIIGEDQLTHTEICELLNLPGSYVEGNCSNWTKVCDGGSRDGKECTYDIDYCTGGVCVDSEINYLVDYYSCICDDILADLSGASGPLDGLADEYNSWIFASSDTIFYPFYEIEDFSIKYLYQDGYDENYTDFLDGLKFIFNNNVEKVEDLENGKVKVNTLQSFNSSDEETSLADYIDVSLEYGNGGNVFENKPSYSYRIEFSDVPKHEAGFVTPASACSGDRPKSLLPFKVINTTTNRVVGVNHVDKGGFYDESGEYNAYGTCVEDGNPCSQNEYCNVNECLELKGYGDCAWEKNERTSFTQDTVHVGLTTRETAEYTFDLKIDYRVYSLYSKGIDPSQIEPWSLGQVYETGDIVKYNDMFWEALFSSDPLVDPVQWVEDGNGENNSAWTPVYPWDDGDYIIIEPTRWYVDGDSWIADLSSLGNDGDITEESLRAISVVPNPYLVYSDYDETPSSRRLWFNHLPTKCRITIYTISGERVASILHEDELSGKESWDLRPQGSNELVAPGLYIYTVESENGSGEYIKHISKFAIVR